MLRMEQNRTYTIAVSITEFPLRAGRGAEQGACEGIPVPQTGCPYHATNGAESRPQRIRHSYHHIFPLSVENILIELPCIFCVYEGSALR